MKGSHWLWILMVLIICVTTGLIISELNMPKLTDPVAQRIWAATNGKIIYLDAKDLEKIINGIPGTDSSTYSKEK
jgi:hypothetical protein